MLLLLFSSHLSQASSCGTPISIHGTSGNISLSYFLRNSGGWNGFGTVVTNVNLHLAGNLVVDGPLTLEGCKITFDPGFGIKMGDNQNTTPGSVLSILGTTLDVCGTGKWSGIEIDGSSYGIVVNNYVSNGNVYQSQINSALTGIALLRTSTTAGSNCASYDIENSGINSCWVGIRIDGVPNTTASLGTGSNRNTITGNKIYGSNGASQVPTNLNTYGAYLNGDKGIWVTNNVGGGNNTPIVIGAMRNSNYPPDPGSYSNYIYVWGCMIYTGDNTNVSVQGNFIDHAVNVSTSTLPPYVGYSIYANGGNNNTLTVGDNIQSPTQNTLREAVNGGVGSEGDVSLTVSNNYLYFNPTSQISVHNNSLNTDIEYNSMYSADFDNYGTFGTQLGISINGFNQVNNTASLTIHHNNIQMLDIGNNVQQSTRQSTAIFLNLVGATSAANNNLTPGTTATIDHNTISRTSFGIWANACANLNVTDNAISLRCNQWTPPSGSNTQPYWVGLYNTASQGSSSFFDNTVNLDVDANSPTYSPSSPGYPAYNANATLPGKIYGFLSANPRAKGNTAVNCNTFNNMHWGITAEGPSLSIMQLHGNVINDAHVGICLANSGYIGQQGSMTIPSDNQWHWAGTNEYALYYFNTPNGGSGNDIYLRAVGSAYHPNPFNQLPMRTGYFQFPIHNTPTPSALAPVCPSATPGGGHLSGYSQSQLMAIASGSLGFADYPTETQKYMAEMVVAAVAADPWLLDSLPALDSFVAAAQQQAFGQLMAINTGMIDPSASDQQIDDWIAQNLAINTTDQNEANLQVLNDLYLNYFAKGYSYDMTDDDLATLQSIAQQCYVVGGPSVLDARSLYWFVTNTADLQFQDDCIASTGYFKTKNPASIVLSANNKFKVYPSPVSSGSDIHIESGYNGIITFYNVLGQSIYSTNFVEGDNIINRESLNTNEGMLMYKSWGNDGTTKEGKLIISK